MRKVVKYSIAALTTALFSVAEGMDRTKEYQFVERHHITKRSRKNRVLQHDSRKKKNKKSSWKHDVDAKDDDDIERNTGKGGKGKGTKPPEPEPDPPGDRFCKSSTAERIVKAIPEVFTKNPSRCCNHDGPVVAYVTHSEVSNATKSGFDEFWNTVYSDFEARAEVTNHCFVMTGVDQTVRTSKSLSAVLIEVNRLLTTFAEVPAIMTTDPTEDVRLLQEVRFIMDSMIDGPSIGVFNAGYSNIVVEALVSRKPKLQYIGYIDDRDYGKKSAIVAQQLLKEKPAVPLCFNGRPDLTYVGERCGAFYASSTLVNIKPAFGIPCTADSSVDDIYNLIVNTTANSILAHVDCCLAVSSAVVRAKADNIDNYIVIGCQDKDTTGGVIDYVTAQPSDLLVYQTASWVWLPAREATRTKYLLDGRRDEVFPSTQSAIVTEIFSSFL